MLEKTIHQTVSENTPIMAPFLLVAGTDSKHFIPLTDAIYRFNGITITPEEFRRYHGTDERIAVIEYICAIRFYYQLLRNANEL